MLGTPFPLLLLQTHFRFGLIWSLQEYIFRNSFTLTPLTTALGPNDEPPGETKFLVASLFLSAWLKAEKGVDGFPDVRLLENFL